MEFHNNCASVEIGWNTVKKMIKTKQYIIVYINENNVYKNMLIAGFW